ncbi:hypothetical protein T439DRAFT_9958 [Meredithblackwellia eburnea MCA 4105]
MLNSDENGAFRQRRLNARLACDSEKTAATTVMVQKSNFTDEVDGISSTEHKENLSSNIRQTSITRSQTPIPTTPILLPRRSHSVKSTLTTALSSQRVSCSAESGTCALSPRSNINLGSSSPVFLQDTSGKVARRQLRDRVGKGKRGIPRRVHFNTEANDQHPREDNSEKVQDTLSQSTLSKPDSIRDVAPQSLSLSSLLRHTDTDLTISPFLSQLVEIASTRELTRTEQRQYRRHIRTMYEDTCSTMKRLADLGNEGEREVYLVALARKGLEKLQVMHAFAESSDEVSLLWEVESAISTIEQYLSAVHSRASDLRKKWEEWVPDEVPSFLVRSPRPRLGIVVENGIEWRHGAFGENGEGDDRVVRLPGRRVLTPKQPSRGYRHKLEPMRKFAVANANLKRGYPMKELRLFDFV